jgi:hypothetical protein
MTAEKVVQLVREQIQHHHPGGVTLTVVPEGVYQQNGYWYVPVRPSAQPPKMFEYYEALAEVASTLEENDQLPIWLMPLLPEEEVTPSVEPVVT